MLLNLDMITDRISDYVIKSSLNDHENLLSLGKWQLYDGESKLLPSVLYIAASENISSRITGPHESALIIYGNPSSGTGRIRCPYAVIDADRISFTRLINAVSSAFFHYDELDRNLHEALYKGESIQRLVDIISPVMSNELILMNSDFQLIAQTYPESRLYKQNAFVQDLGKEYIPSEVLTFFKNDPIYSSVRDEKEPFLYKASVHNVDIWCMNVFLNNEFICRVTMPESENPFRPYDKELLRYFTSIIQHKYNDLKSVDSFRKSNRLSGILLDLMEGKNVEDNQLYHALGLYRIGSGCEYQCIVIQPSDRDYYNKTLSAYCEYIEKNYPGSVAFEYKEEIVSILMLPPVQTEQEAFRRNIIEFLRDNFLKAGFSNPYSDIREISIRYKQAKAALKTGQQLNSFKWVFYFQEECLEYMKELITAELPPIYLCSTKVTVLLDYDKTHHTDYIQTLSVYLSTGRNAVETANKMYLHRSTMMYRLKRIREISGINFQDPDELLFIMISLRLLRH